MHSLLLGDEYHEIIKQLNKNKCWACHEGLSGNSSMHDCEEDFHMIIEYFFDEATFFVNSEIRKQDFNFQESKIYKMLYGTCLVGHSYT